MGSKGAVLSPSSHKMEKVTVEELSGKDTGEQRQVNPLCLQLTTQPSFAKSEWVPTSKMHHQEVENQFPESRGNVFISLCINHLSGLYGSHQ